MLCAARDGAIVINFQYARANDVPDAARQSAEVGQFQTRQTDRRAPIFSLVVVYCLA
jgi:hypothetical protein